MTGLSRRPADRGCPRGCARRSSCRWSRSCRTGAGDRRPAPVPYTHADRSPSMPRGSSTTRIGRPAPAAMSAPSASVTIATAPLSAAARANSAPWRFTPRIATNASPARRSAVASVMPLTETPSRSPRVSRANRPASSASERAGGFSGRRTGGRFEGASVDMSHQSSHRAPASHPPAAERGMPSQPAGLTSQANSKLYAGTVAV